MRCLGETAKSLGEGEWLCPECGMGGRGEAAGLRIPVGARNKWKQPYHAMHGMLCRTAPPAVRSRGSHAEEQGARVAAALYRGEGAEEELQATNRVRSSDEVPHPSSFEAIRDPPKIVLGEAGD